MKGAAALLAIAAAVALGVWLAWPHGSDMPPTVRTEQNDAKPAPRVDPPSAPSPPTRALVSAGAGEAATPAAALGHVRGRVVDALGQPLPDCDVAFLALVEEPAFAPAAPRPPLATCRSDAGGRFQLDLETHAPGLVTLRHRDFPPHVAAHGLAVDQGQTRDLGDITLFSQPGLLVHVKAAAGNGIGDAVVTASPALQDVSLPSAIHALRERTGMTDGSGQAVLYGVAPGPYVVRVEAPSYATLEVNHLQPDHPPHAPQLELSLEPGCVIRGRVQPPDGVDPGRIFVTAEALEGGPVLRDQVRANGDFRVTGAQPGRYRVIADSTRLGPTAVETLVPSNAVLVVALSAGLTLRGVVRDATTGAPVPEATVVAEPADGWPLSRAGETLRPDARSDGDGNFCISGLPPGRFTLTASSKWFVPTRIEAIEAGAEPTEIRLDAGLSVSGRVQRNGSPVAGANVRAIPWSSESAAFALWRANLTEDNTTRATVTGADGRFTLAGIAIQGQRLTISADDCTLWFSEPLSGNKGQSLDLGTIAVRPGATIAGSAAAHATVCLQTRGGRALSLTTTADATGRFAFRGLPAGDYELFYHSAGEPRAPAAARVPADPKTVVTVHEGERKDISLQH